VAAAVAAAVAPAVAIAVAVVLVVVSHIFLTAPYSYLLQPSKV
jgi:hypothetical protein